MRSYQMSFGTKFLSMWRNLRVEVKRSGPGAETAGSDLTTVMQNLGCDL